MTSSPSSTSSASIPIVEGASTCCAIDKRPDNEEVRPAALSSARIFPSGLETVTGRAVRVWPASGATDAATAAKNTRIVLPDLHHVLPRIPISSGSANHDSRAAPLCVSMFRPRFYFPKM